MIIGTTLEPRPPVGRESFRRLLTASPEQSWETFRNLFNARPPGKSYIDYDEFVHSCVFAPSGGGKGVSIVIPTLISNPSAIVTFDPKGENYALTAQWRRQQFGHRCLRYDPFGVHGEGSEGFNPLAYIDPASPSVIDQCRALAMALVVRGQEQESHWNDMAEFWLCGLMAMLVSLGRPEAANLQTLRSVTASLELFDGMVGRMRESTACEGLIARFGNQMSSVEGKEKSGVISSINRHMSFLDSIPAAHHTKRSTFDPKELQDGKTDLFLILPANYTRSHNRLSRLWLTSCLMAQMHAGPQEERPVYYLLDEVAQLGPMQPLEDAIVLARGYGVRTITIWQGIGQLEDVFPGDKKNTFLSNQDLQIYFGPPNDYETCEHISKTIGDTTTFTVGENSGMNGGWSVSYGSESGSSSEGRSGGWSNGVNVSETKRRLMNPDEIRTMPPDQLIAFARGTPPIRARRIFYYADPLFTRPKKKTSGRLSGLLTAVRAALFSSAVLAGGLGALVATFPSKKGATPLVEQATPGAPDEPLPNVRRPETPVHIPTPGDQPAAPLPRVQPHPGWAPYRPRW